MSNEAVTSLSADDISAEVERLTAQRTELSALVSELRERLDAAVPARDRVDGALAFAQRLARRVTIPAAAAPVTPPSGDASSGQNYVP